MTKLVSSALEETIIFQAFFLWIKFYSQGSWNVNACIYFSVTWLPPVSKPKLLCAYLVTFLYKFSTTIHAITFVISSIATNRPRNSKVSLLLVWCSVPVTVAARSHSGKAEQIHEHLPARYYPRFSWGCISCVLQHCKTLTWMQDAKLISLWTAPLID